MAGRPGPRDRAVAAVRRTRIAEIRGLDVADVRLSARKGEIHLIGKGEKSRTVAVHPMLGEALAAWLEERPSKPGAGSSALFPSGRGTRMTTGAIADVITAITTAAGMDHATGYVLRHTFGTELTRHGVDIVTVAVLKAEEIGDDGGSYHKHDDGDGTSRGLRGTGSGRADDVRAAAARASRHADRDLRPAGRSSGA